MIAGVALLMWLRRDRVAAPRTRTA
jgi:hypothetical protein